MEPNHRSRCDETWPSFSITKGCSRPRNLYGFGRRGINYGGRRDGNYDPDTLDAVNQDVVQFLRYCETMETLDASLTFDSRKPKIACVADALFLPRSLPIPAWKALR